MARRSKSRRKSRRKSRKRSRRKSLYKINDDMRQRALEDYGSSAYKSALEIKLKNPKFPKNLFKKYKKLCEKNKKLNEELRELRTEILNSSL